MRSWIIPSQEILDERSLSHRILSDQQDHRFCSDLTIRQGRRVEGFIVELLLNGLDLFAINFLEALYDRTILSRAGQGARLLSLLRGQNHNCFVDFPVVIIYNFIIICRKILYSIIRFYLFKLESQ